MRLRKALWPALILAALVVLWLSAQAAVAAFFPFDYRELVAQSAAANGLDEYLVAAVVKAESSWIPDATSQQGARGLMQLLPDTGRQAAAANGMTGFNPEMLYDPGINLRLGCWYLASLRRQFDGSVVLAVAAYNSGSENVRRWVAEQRWSGEGSALERIPFAETREYVRRVTTNAVWYRRFYDRHSLLARLLWPGEK